MARTMNINEGMLTAALKSEPDSTVIACVTYILCQLSQADMLHALFICKIDSSTCMNPNCIGGGGGGY